MGAANGSGLYFPWFGIKSALIDDAHGEVDGRIICAVNNPLIILASFS